MKRVACIAAPAVAVTGVMLTVFVNAAPAQRPFDAKSLQGAYVGGVIEIRQDPVRTGPIEYCDSSGTFTFSGKGTGTSSLTRRCSLHDTVVDNLTLTYTVTPEGVVNIKFSSGTLGRGQLTLGGQGAFVSLGGGPGNHVLVHQGHFLRQDR